MIKIGLLGYGKMGKAIEALADQHQVEIVWKAGRDHRTELSDAALQLADVVIEFSRPEAGYDNVLRCIEAGVPVVSGTTGWNDQIESAREICRERGGAFLWASNFSIGVNLFFALNKQLAVMMSKWEMYQADLTETHHIHKLDAPSGTAVTLAEGIIAASEAYDHWALEENAQAGALSIAAIREGEVPGTHKIRWTGPNDEITIEHRAFSRDGFASGAIVAAKWLVGKKGVYSMSEVLG